MSSWGKSATPSRGSSDGHDPAARRGAEVLQDILAALPALYPSLAVSTKRAYEISSQTRHGFYDCLYVALAEREGCELVTADQNFVNNLRPVFPFIRPLASLPGRAGRNRLGTLRGGRVPRHASLDDRPDEQDQLLTRYAVNSVPTYILIGPDGKLLHRGSDLEEVGEMLKRSLR